MAELEKVGLRLRLFHDSGDSLVESETRLQQCQVLLHKVAGDYLVFGGNLLCLLGQFAHDVVLGLLTEKVWRFCGRQSQTAQDRD